MPRQASERTQEIELRILSYCAASGTSVDSLLQQRIGIIQSTVSHYQKEFALADFKNSIWTIRKRHATNQTKDPTTMHSSVPPTPTPTSNPTPAAAAAFTTPVQHPAPAGGHPTMAPPSPYSGFTTPVQHPAPAGGHPTMAPPSPYGGFHQLHQHLGYPDGTGYAPPTPGGGVGHIHVVGNGYHQYHPGMHNNYPGMPPPSMPMSQASTTGGLSVASGLSLGGLSLGSTTTTRPLVSFDEIQTQEDICSLVTNGPELFALGSHEPTCKALWKQLGPDLDETIRNLGRKEVSKCNAAIPQFKKVLAELVEQHDKKVAIGQQQVADRKRELAKAKAAVADAEAAVAEAEAAVAADNQKLKDIIVPVQDAVERARDNLETMGKQSDLASTAGTTAAGTNLTQAPPQYGPAPVAASTAPQQQQAVGGFNYPAPAPEQQQQAVGGFIFPPPTSAAAPAAPQQPANSGFHQDHGQQP